MRLEVLKDGDGMAILNLVSSSQKVAFGFVSSSVLCKGPPLPKYYIKVELQRVAINISLIVANTNGRHEVDARHFWIYCDLAKVFSNIG